MTVTEVRPADAADATGTGEYSQGEQMLIGHLREHSQRGAKLAATVATWIETDGEHALRGIGN